MQGRGRRVLGRRRVLRLGVRLARKQITNGLVARQLGVRTRRAAARVLAQVSARNGHRCGTLTSSLAPWDRYSLADSTEPCWQAYISADLHARQSAPA